MSFIGDSTIFLPFAGLVAGAIGVPKWTLTWLLVSSMVWKVTQLLGETANHQGVVMEKTSGLCRMQYRTWLLVSFVSYFIIFGALCFEYHGNGDWGHCWELSWEEFFFQATLVHVLLCVVVLCIRFTMNKEMQNLEAANEQVSKQDECRETREST